MPTPVETRLVAGYVVDGPIANSRISLIDPQSGLTVEHCGPSGGALCETRSRDNGYFYLAVARNFDTTGLKLVAVRGVDQATGVSFDKLPMAISTDLFGGRLNDVVISPVTSLVSSRLSDGLDPAAAANEVAAWLGLPAGSNLLIPGDQDPSLQIRALLLTKLALELQRVRGSDDPFTFIAGNLGSTGMLVNSAEELQVGSLATIVADSGAEGRISALFERLKQHRDAPVEIFVEEELFQALSEHLKYKFAQDSSFDPADPQFLANGRLLAETVRKAVLPQLIPLNQIVPQRLMRYVLFTYNLNSFADFTAATDSFRARIDGGQVQPALIDNSRLAGLCGITSFYSVEVPLLPQELPGDDNAKRLNYYYNSDISNFYLAELLIGHISDDVVNDSILLAIVDQKAKVGLFQDAEKIIGTQIQQSFYQGMAYVSLAYWMNRLGEFAEADRVLQIGYPIFQSYLQLVPPTSLKTLEIRTIFRYAANFRRAGNLEASQKVYAELAALTSVNPSSTLSGRLIIEARDYVAELLADGFIDEARAQIDSMHLIASDTPANQTVFGGTLYQYYKARVFYLVVTAQAYADLGDFAEVQNLYQEIQGLRDQDGLSGLTANETWYYMVQLVQVLYQSGFGDQALALAASIPDSYLNYAGLSRSGTFYQASAYVSVATYEALSQGFDAALAIINSHFSSVEDKVDALTYFAHNKSVPHVGLALLDNGQLTDAVKALDEATRLLDGFSSASDSDLYKVAIEFGYVKLADLYLSAGDQAQAAALLAKAGELTMQLGDPFLQVQAYLDLSGGYEGLGQMAVVEQMLNAAAQVALNGEAQLDATQAANAYELVIDACLGHQGSFPLDTLVTRMQLAAGDIYDNSRAYVGTQHDTTAGVEVTYLLKVAVYQAKLGNRDAALATFDQARGVAMEIFTQDKRMDKLCGEPGYADRYGVAGGLAAAGFLDQAIAFAENSTFIPFVSSRNQALQKIAEVLTERDAFPHSDLASVDTDADGLPDFFSPAASADEIAASGLQLDPDSDNDGVPDTSDRRPLFFDAGP